MPKGQGPLRNRSVGLDTTVHKAHHNAQFALPGLTATATRTAVPNYANPVGTKLQKVHVIVRIARRGRSATFMAQPHAARGESFICLDSCFLVEFSTFPLNRQ
jgi:hypothetical protein